MKERILRLIPSYRKLVKELEKTNADLDKETAEKNRMQRRINTLDIIQIDLKIRTGEAIEMIEKTKLKQETKNKIIKKLTD